MDIKIIFSVIATFIGVIAFIPYLKDIFSLKTKPHIYTWLIWILTQGTAVVGILYGGGDWGALNLIVGLFFLIIVLFFSLRYGTKNITKGDTIILVLALIAVLIWWQLKQPLISVFMVSVIDTIGYFPSFRKSYQEPWSETLITWFLFAMSNIFAVLALKEYNLLTLTYLASITIANCALFLICYFRRRFVPKPLT
ncbi:MAG: hypothetical protein WCX74_01405 [Candidatus Paceibacterota bacterium]